MADKQTHIDETLFRQLNALEAAPDPAAWQALAPHLHPADMAISASLQDLTADASADSKAAIFSALQHSAHPVDAALSERLGNLQTDPGLPLQAVLPARRKRRLAFWFLLLPLLLALTGLYRLLNHAPNENASISARAKPSETAKDAELPEQTPLQAVAETDAKDGKVLSKELTTRSTARQSGPNEDALKPIPEMHLETGNALAAAEEQIPLLRYSGLAAWPYFTSLIADETKPKRQVILQMKTSKTVRLSRFAFSAGMGLLAEQSLSSGSAEADVHKDVQSNFQSSAAARRSGIQFFTLFDFRILPRFILRSGVSFSSSSVNSRFDYVYNEVPVYNPDGSILSYFIRPYASSPQVHETIRSSSRSVTVPLHLLYRLYAGKRLSYWAGAGVGFNVQQNIQAQVFSFNEESLVALKNQGSSLLQGNVNMQLNYRIKAGWSVNLLLQAQRRKDFLEADGIHYHNTLLLPAFSIGLSYQPQIPIK